MYKRNVEFLGFFLSLMVLFPTANAAVNPESIIQIFQRLEILEKKSRELTGQNEVLKNQLEQIKKAQKQGFLNVDEQVDELRQEMKDNTSASPAKPAAINETPKVKVVAPTLPIAVTPKPPTKEASTPPKKEAPIVVKTDGVKTTPASDVEKTTATNTEKSRAPSAYEKETYQAAFNKMSSSPTAATNAFKEYILLQPKSPLAANAQYWIGEIMYSHNNYKGAVDEFIKVLQLYKSSSKAPDAALKLGYSFYALKNWEYARRTFEDVLKYFPDNKNAVNLATKRLEKMKAAGN